MGFLVSCDAVRIGQEDPIELKESHLPPYSGPVSPSVSCHVSCQPPGSHTASPTSWHVRSYRDTSRHGGTQHAGARAGSRTLNLGIKRRLTVVARKCQGVPGRASRTWRSDAFLSQSVVACHGVPRVRCQLSCQCAATPDDIEAIVREARYAVPTVNFQRNRLRTSPGISSCGEGVSECTHRGWSIIRALTPGS